MTAPRDSKSIEATRPATIARDRLSTALQLIQEVPNPPPALEKATAFIAKSVGALFSVQSSSPEAPEHTAGVRHAMQHVASALEAMQDVQLKSREADNATAELARTLSVLYPISKVQERQQKGEAEPRPSQPLPDDPRRKSLRLTIETDVGFQTESNFYTGLTQDISEGGLFLATYELQPIGTKMAVSFSLPDGHFVSCVGVVRWIREYNEMTPDIHPGIGLQFTELQAEDKQAVEGFLHRRPALFYED